MYLQCAASTAANHGRQADLPGGQDTTTSVVTLRLKVTFCKKVTFWRDVTFSVEVKLRVTFCGELKSRITVTFSRVNNAGVSSVAPIDAMSAASTAAMTPAGLKSDCVKSVCPKVSALTGGAITQVSATLPSC